MEDIEARDVAIKVDNVSKVFKLPHEKTTSIKSLFINFYRPSRSYEMYQALKNISFEIKKGEFFGIVGRNGSGKSTLLKLLAGIYTPNSGNIMVKGRLVPFIELGVGFDMDLSGRDNVYLNGALLGFSRKEMDAMYKEIVEFAELEKFMDQKLKNYSSGMQVRLAFSIAIRAKSDVLLIDEVLAVGDADFQRKSLSYFKQLKKDKKTVVFVSHDMTSVKEFCDRGILIENGEIQFEGTANELADKYSLLFIEENRKSSAESEEPKRSLEGSGAARVVEASTTVSEDKVRVQAKVKVNKNIGGLQYGIHILAQDGSEIAAMNNRMLQLPDIKEIEKGSDINFEWRILNIFNDGRFFVTLSLADNVGNMLDRLDDATSFRIKRKERSSTAVLPPVEVSYKI